MNKSIQFETESGETFSLDIAIFCHDLEGVDASFEIEYSDKPIDSLSPKDQTRLERQCQTCADDTACYAAQEYAEGAADAAYDAWRDRDI